MLVIHCDAESFQRLCDLIWEDEDIKDIYDPKDVLRKHVSWTADGDNLILRADKDNLFAVSIYLARYVSYLDEQGKPAPNCRIEIVPILTTDSELHSITIHDPGFDPFGGFGRYITPVK